MNPSELLSLTLTELALSVDNALVWVLVLKRLGLARRTERAVLAAGVAIAFVARFVAISLGAEAVARWWFVTPALGVVLIVTGAKLICADNDDTDTGLVDRLARWMTPALAGVVSLGAIDVLFAVDSIPASFGISQHAGTIITANAIALAALWSIYGVVSKLITRLPYLHYGLAAVLVWLGVGMVLGADMPESANLAVITALLGVSAVWSLRAKAVTA